MGAWHDNIMFLLAAVINISALAGGWADLRRQVKTTVERVSRLDATIHNGLSERLIRIEDASAAAARDMARFHELPQRIATIEARCAERAARDGH